jgi:hypothetical protein
MSEMNLREMIDLASANAEHLFNENGEISLPIWHAMQADGEQFVLPTMAPKDLQMEFVRWLFKENDVVRYVQIAEMWIAQIELTDEEKKDLTTTMLKYKNVRGRADRREIVFLQGEDHVEGMLAAERPIIRDGSKPRLGPLKFWHVDMTMGWMSGLLPRKGELQ